MKFVYVMRCGKDHYKVGIAINVGRRVAELQTSNPEPIEVVATKLVDNASVVEQSVHIYLKEHKANGGREWFKLSPEQVIEVLILINKHPEVEGLTKTLKMKDMVDRNMSQMTQINNRLDVLTSFVTASSKTQSVVNESTKAEPEMPIRERFVRPKKPTVDEYIESAIEIFKKDGRASTSLLQRRLSIGYAKAARIMDELQDRDMLVPQGLAMKLRD